MNPVGFAFSHVMAGHKSVSLSLKVNDSEFFQISLDIKQFFQVLGFVEWSPFATFF